MVDAVKPNSFARPPLRREINWWGLVGVAIFFAVAGGFWSFFIWAGTRYWPH